MFEPQTIMSVRTSSELLWTIYMSVYWAEWSEPQMLWSIRKITNTCDRLLSQRLSVGHNVWNLQWNSLVWFSNSYLTSHSGPKQLTGGAKNNSKYRGWRFAPLDVFCCRSQVAPLQTFSDSHGSGPKTLLSDRRYAIGLTVICRVYSSIRANNK